jgi:hypothetical protein
MRTATEYADKNACGTCRTLTADGKPVEHEECAARAQLIEAPDAPDFEDLAELTLEQKAALPARFHVPRFVDSATPQMWLCAVCWDEGGASQWPCATASEKGAEVFTR